MGAKPLFCPPIIRREAETETTIERKRSTFWIKGVNFVKKLSMTKKKVVRNFGENRRERFKIFCLKITFPKIFAPPIFVTQIFAPPIFVTQIFAPQYLWQVYAYARCLSISIALCPSMALSFSLSVCLYVHVSLCLSLYLSLPLFDSLCLYLYLSLFLCLLLCLYGCLSHSVSFFRSLSLHLSLYM